MGGKTRVLVELFAGVVVCKDIAVEAPRAGGLCVPGCSQGIQEAAGQSLAAVLRFDHEVEQVGRRLPVSSKPESLACQGSCGDEAAVLLDDQHFGRVLVITTLKVIAPFVVETKAFAL